MRGILNKLLPDVGNLLEWEPASKATLLLGITTLIHTQYILWANYQIVFAESAGNLAFVNVDYIAYQLDRLGWIVYFSLALFIGVFLLRRRYPRARVFEHIAAEYFAITMSYFSYLIGNLSIATGVVIAGAPVCAFILFNRQVVLWAFAVSLLAQAVISAGGLMGWLEYAPVVRNMVLEDGRVSAYWLSNMYWFTAPHLALLVVAAYSSLKYWRKREEQVKQLSLTDVLTQLSNRRSVLDTLAKEVARSARNGTSLSIAIVDLDHFKHINDTLGHAAGDRVLVAAGQALKSALRTNDHIGRYGGEEFLLILPETRIDDAEQLAERCRHQLEQLPIVLDSGVVTHVTGSFGLFCNCLNHQEMPEKMLHFADEALYKAKELGRNRVESAPDLPHRHAEAKLKATV